MKFANMKLKCQVCGLNFVGEREGRKGTHGHVILLNSNKYHVNRWHKSNC